MFSDSIDDKISNSYGGRGVLKNRENNFGAKEEVIYCIELKCGSYGRSKTRLDAGQMDGCFFGLLALRNTINDAR